MHKTAKYLITFTQKCFALAVVAINAELRATLLNKICKMLQFLCHFVNSACEANSAHNDQLCAIFCTLRITEF